MAEAAGLALGGIALASLITTCVGFTEYFENGRHYVRDISLAAYESQGLLNIDRQAGREERTHARYALPEAVLGIKEVLRRTTQLCRKYNRGRRQQVLISGSGGLRAPIEHRLARSQERLTPGHREDPYDSLSSPWVLTVSRSISWAFLDKKRFNDLISDFDFILSNLEKIIEGFNTKHENHHWDAPGMPEMSTQGKKMNWFGSQTALGAAARGVESVSAPSTGAWGGVVYRENHSKDQSIHILGSQLQQKDTHVKLGPGIRAVYEGNVAHDQSFMCSGPANPILVETMAEQWRKVAMAAIAQKNMRQVSVSCKNSEMSYRFSNANKTRQQN